MNSFIIAAIGLGMAMAIQVTAQQAAEPRGGDRQPPPRGEQGPGPGRGETLTAAQTEQVKVILSKYDADALTADQAKAIHEAFRQAGMRGGPAMGKRDFDISTSLTGDSGKDFLAALTPEQRQHVTAIPDLQRKALQEVIEVRRAIATELRRFLKGEPADKAKVLALGRRYGELDGEVSWLYATAFAKVNRTLTADQRQTLMKLRNLDGYTSAPAYIYSTSLSLNNS